MFNKYSKLQFIVIGLFFIDIQCGLYSPSAIEVAEIEAKAKEGIIADELAKNAIEDSVAKRVAAAEEVKRLAREKAMNAELAKPYLKEPKGNEAISE